MRRTCGLDASAGPDLAPHRGAMLDPAVLGSYLAVTLGSFGTILDPAEPERNANIALAAERLNGTCIEAGASFSFDAAVGPRRLGDGYAQAPAILEGELDLAPAGGICQLSTTLYNAALHAGLVVVERHPHPRRAAYVAPGRDATVARFWKDLKLRNDLGQPVQIRSRVLGDRLIVEVLGERPGAVIHDVEIRSLSGDPLEVQAFRVSRSRDGNVKRELLSHDIYR